MDGYPLLLIAVSICNFSLRKTRFRKLSKTSQCVHVGVTRGTTYL